MFKEIIDPLSIGHAKAEKIMEEKKRQAEDAEAVERSDFEEVLEKQRKEELKKEYERQLRQSLEEKENPGEELYGRFEQFRGQKIPGLGEMAPEVKKDGQKGQKKGGNNYPHRGRPRLFDPYK